MCPSRRLSRSPPLGYFLPWLELFILEPRSFDRWVSRDAESSERSAWRDNAGRAPLGRLRVAANHSCGVQQFLQLADRLHQFIGPTEAIRNLDDIAVMRDRRHFQHVRH